LYKRFLSVSLLPQPEPSAQCRARSSWDIRTYSSYDATPLLFLRHSFLYKDVVSQFRTSSTHGLTAAVIPSLHQAHGYNEFSVSSLLNHFSRLTKIFYESPLVLLLCGSAAVSAIMGNVDDAVSISIVIVIVLTGMRPSPSPATQSSSPSQSASYGNDVPKGRSRRSTRSSLTTVTSSAMESKYTSSQVKSYWATSSPSSPATASRRTYACLLLSTSRLTRADGRDHSAQEGCRAVSRGHRDGRADVHSQHGHVCADRYVLPRSLSHSTDNLTFVPKAVAPALSSRRYL